jgi:uncharacterized protein (TIGR00369 family)
MSMPDLATLKQMFRRAPFIAELGMELESLGDGECVTMLRVEPRHLQQNGMVHAGVQATMADHTAGAAASTVAPAGAAVLTAEFKISLLKAARGDLLRCRARVIKPGRQLVFVESEVWCTASGQEHLVSKSSATMSLVAVSELRGSERREAP